MNEQELRERMQSSVLTEFAPDAIDPAADVMRGRRGLRRRRLIGGLTAAASMVAVSAVGASALGAQQAPVASTDTSPPAVKHTVNVDSIDDYGVRVRFLALTVAVASQKHLGKSYRYLPGTDVSPTAERDGNGVSQMTVLQTWKQSGGTGLLWVSMSKPSRALPREKWCGPSYTPDLLRMTCSNRLTPQGKRVVVGQVGAVQNSKGVVYKESGGTFVRYVRPDGQVVIVAALGMKSLKRVADGLPKGVKHPDVTWQQLAAIATDPQLNLGK